MCVMHITRSNDGFGRIGDGVPTRVECDDVGCVKKKLRGGRVAMIKDSLNEWRAVDVAAVFVVLLGLLLSLFNARQSVVMVFLFVARFVMAFAIANRPRKWFFILGVAALVSAVVALCNRDASYIELFYICQSWIVLRTILTLMRSLVGRITWMNVSFGTVFGWCAFALVMSMITHGYEWIKVFSLVQSVMSCVGIFWNVRDNSAVEGVLLFTCIVGAYRGMVWYIPMVVASFYAVLAWSGRLAAVVGVSIDVTMVKEQVQGRYKSPIKALYEVANRSTDKIAMSVWNSLNLAGRGEKTVDLVRQYALLGDRFLALALETYCFERQMIPGYIMEMRTSLLSNKAMSKVFDEQLSIYFPGMSERSQARKGTIFEALVGVTISSFPCLREFESLLQAIADVIGKKHLVAGDAQWKNFSETTDSSFDLKVMEVLCACVGNDFFDWSTFYDVYTDNSHMDRKFLKRLSRVGRAALEASFVLDNVPCSDVTDMSDFIALRFNEANIANAWRGLAKMSKCEVLDISDKTASENMFALIAILFQMCEYEMISHFSEWFRNFVSDDGMVCLPR